MTGADTPKQKAHRDSACLLAHYSQFNKAGLEDGLCTGEAIVNDLPDDADRYDDTFEMPPEHVVKAMSQIAIYAATHGTDSMYLRDPVVSVPIGVVQEWLKEWGFEFDEVRP